MIEVGFPYVESVGIDFIDAYGTRRTVVQFSSIDDHKCFLDVTFEDDEPVKCGAVEAMPQETRESLVEQAKRLISFSFPVSFGLRPKWKTIQERPFDNRCGWKRESRWHYIYANVKTLRALQSHVPSRQRYLEAITEQFRNRHA